MMETDLLVIGAGPAGLAASIAAKRAGTESVLILEREPFPGGILRQCIHNGFGLHRFNEELTGPEYAQRDILEARELGISIQCSTMVLSVHPDLTVEAVSAEHGYQQIRAHAIILAMGCRERPRGALCTPGSRCAGIYTAGTAQRFVNLEGFMPGKKVVILGSGDIGLIMARRMVLQGAEVSACVEIMPYSSGLNRNIVQCLEDYSIPLLLNHTVTEIIGRDRLEAVVIAEVDCNRKPIPGTEQKVLCDTLLLSCGLIPENELSVSAGITLSSATSGPVVDDLFETNVPGIFACGNVLHVHDLVDNVSEESFKAGKAAAEYINGRLSSPAASVRVLDGPGIRGTVPQMIRAESPEGVTLSFRPAAVYRHSSVVVMSGDTLIARKKSLVFTPGEMVSITLSADQAKQIHTDSITVQIMEGNLQ